LFVFLGLEEITAHWYSGRLAPVGEGKLKTGERRGMSGGVQGAHPYTVDRAEL
jgi:hypothetical protein